jgi:hypothetical protein
MAAVFVSVCMLFAATDPMKPFFWSPHNQMFNILVPVLALWATLRAAEGALTDWRFALICGVIVGAGFTAYPLFLIVVPCAVIGALYALVRARSGTLLFRSALNAALMFVLAVAPQALWFFFVRARTGGFYQYEMEHDRLVLWIADIWHQGILAVVARWLSNFTSLFSQIGLPLLPAVALLAVLAGIALANRAAVRPHAGTLVRLALSTVVVMLMTAAFYATTGLTVWRVAFALVPPLIAGTGDAVYVAADGLAPEHRRIVALACVLIALAQSIVIVVKSGPYS